MLAAQLAAVEKAPLAERQAWRAECLDAMKDPATIQEHVSWLLEGCYGFGACKAAIAIVAQKRGNREAALMQLVAALDCACPVAMCRAAWNKLTPAQQKRLTAAIRRGMKTAPAILVVVT